MLETGIDIIEVKRIAKAIGNPSFISKYFHPVEIEYSGNSVNAAQHYAARFAAKEAVRKVLLSYVDNLSWLDTWIENDETGKPRLVFSENVLMQIDIRQTSCSLSHTSENAIASVILDVKLMK